MNKRQANRMLKLARTLRTRVNPVYFNMEFVSRGPINEEHPCGTSACAIGHIPLAYPRSWKLEPYPRNEGYNSVVHRVTGEGFSEHEFFGLDGDDAFHLFHGNRTLEQQAQLMEDFVRKQGYEVKEGT